jgi:hypothetical protein
MVETANPLNKYYRQPSIYISLPSRGAYYSDQVFKSTDTGEIPVLPMTAKDEIAFKTPDAMINGQATVDVIRSCCPNLLDPWQMVNYDLDAVLIAIRIATYGETMDFTAIVPVVNEQVSHTVNLPSLLDQTRQIKIKEDFKTKNGFVFTVKPLTYKEVTNIQVKTFEQQKQLVQTNVPGANVTEEQKTQRFAEAYKALTELNFQMLSNAFTKIVTPDGDTVTDKAQIVDFLQNADSVFVNEVQDKMIELRSQAQIKPLKMKSTEEQIKKGAPVSFDVPITFDNSNFFV